MASISLRAQLRLVALGYAAVLLFAASVLYGRHLQELRYPAEASGGMWAAGDGMLLIFVACLFMIPTTFLVWVIARFESLGKAYSQFLLGLSLSAPFAWECSPWARAVWRRAWALTVSSDSSRHL